MKSVVGVLASLILPVVMIIFLPIVVDGFGFGKGWVLGAAGMVGMVGWAVSLVVDKDRAKIKGNGALGWLLGWAVWAGVSWGLEMAGVRMRAVTNNYGIGTMLALTGAAFLWLQLGGEKEKSLGIKMVTGVGVAMAVMSLVIFILPAKRLPINIPATNPWVSIGPNWSLTGSLLAEVVVLLTLVWIWGEKLVAKMKGGQQYITEICLGGFLTLVLLLDIFRIVRGGWGAIDGRTSWMVALEAIKQSPFLGAGIGNFVEAFYWWRPVTFNQTSLWSGVFAGGGSFWLQVWAELGIVGAVAMLMVWWRGWKGQIEKSDRVRVAVVGLAVMGLPFSVVTAGWWLWLAFGGKVKAREFGLSLKAGERGFNVAPVINLVIVAVAVAVGGYWWVKVMVADVYFRKSLVAAATNDGSGTYNWQIKAIGLVPNNADYRRLYSQTNIALAVSLLADKNLTDENKQKAVVLIQQAVREAKAVVALDNRNPVYWANLASVYRQLIGNVDGASDWAAQAYAQAVVFDPVNPSLRLDFGGLLYALGNFGEADRAFEQAVSLKPDLANGWYNWAYTAKQQKNLSEAVARLSQALTLVSPESGDYDKASQELAAWKKELAASTEVSAAKAETLKLPEAVPSGKPGVMVPKNGLEPPAGEAIPTETP